MRFENFSRWLQGSFTCRKCGKNYNLMCFGYGEVVCPDCYDNEQPFLLLDDSYWLNRLLMRFRRDNVERTVRVEEEAAIEEVMVDEPLMELVPQH